MEIKQLSSQKRQLDDNEERSKKFKAVHITFDQQGVVYSDLKDMDDNNFSIINKLIKERDDIQKEKEKFEKIFNSIINERNKYHEQMVISHKIQMHLHDVCRSLNNNIEEMNKYIITIVHEKNELSDALNALRVDYTKMSKKIEDDNNSITNFLQLL